MKRLIYTTAVMMMGSLSLYAQDGEHFRTVEKVIDTKEVEMIDLQEYNTDEVVNGLATHQLDGPVILLENKISRIAPDLNKKNVWFENPDENYQLDPEKQYKRYETVDMSRYGSERLLHGMVTHQIHGDRQFVALEDAQSIAGLYDSLNKRINGYDLDTKNAGYAAIPEEDSAKENDEEAIGTTSLLENYFKRYRINSDGSYQYTDGRAIVGNEDVQASLADGYKPITELTFFYEVKKAGLLSEDMSAKEFLEMTASEHQQLISGSYASASIESTAKDNTLMNTMTQQQIEELTKADYINMFSLK